MLRHFFITAWLGLSVVAGAPSMADDCYDCGDFSAYPVAMETLERLGYPASAHVVLVAWTERGQDGSEGLVTGYRVQPKIPGSEPFDCYTADGLHQLTPEELFERGISPKDWDVRPLSLPMEFPMAGPKRADTVPMVSGEVSDYVDLPPLDLAAVHAEDESGGSLPYRRARRIGVFRDLPDGIRVEGADASHGVWTRGSGGEAVWSVAVLSPEAVGVRLHVRVHSLPPGAGIVVYNTEDPGDAHGPFELSGEGPAEWWSPTCFGSEVAIECRVPAGADIAGVHLEVKELGHQYVPMGDLAWTPTKAAGSCEIDVSCHPSWADHALGVGGIGTIGRSGVLWCTGSLLADGDPSTFIPFFLTAHHCVSNTVEAGSVEVYWLYQTPACNGTPPSPALVPRTTGGAVYVAGQPDATGNDFALLRLKQTPPTGLAYLGWTSEAQDTGSGQVSIHHPAGDFKRISFGSTVGKDTNYLEVRWNQGVTEPGSSGSPLLSETSGLVTGQLLGGGSSCASPLATDFYGRFDVTLPVIRQYLVEGKDPIIDPEEPVDPGSGCAMKRLPSADEAQRAQAGFTLPVGAAVVLLLSLAVTRRR